MLNHSAGFSWRSVIKAELTSYYCYCYYYNFKNSISNLYFGILQNFRNFSNPRFLPQVSLCKKQLSILRSESGSKGERVSDEAFKKYAKRGPVTWMSFVAFLLAGGGVLWYVRHLKEEKEKGMYCTVFLNKCCIYPQGIYRTRHLFGAIMFKVLHYVIIICTFICILVCIHNYMHLHLYCIVTHVSK